MTNSSQNLNQDPNSPDYFIIRHYQRNHFDVTPSYCFISVLTPNLTGSTLNECMEVLYNTKHLTRDRGLHAANTEKLGRYTFHILHRSELSLFGVEP